MLHKHTLVKGAAILTLTGLFTRLLGFFYRIFLSRTVGETGMGLYQLIFPVYSFGFSLTCAGIETALSRCVSIYHAKGNEKRSREQLYSSMILTLVFSCIFLFFLQHNAHEIASKYLHNPDTGELLLLLSYVFPFAAIHSCIVGYYLGLKQTYIPSVSQLLEQGFRIFSVGLFYIILSKFQLQFHISFAVIGIIIGELSACIFCLKKICKKDKLFKLPKLSLYSFLSCTKELLRLSLPLTANRTLLNILQSIEAVTIPLSLEQYGFTSQKALSVYGVLTGMALPYILFPSAVTNAISTMLLPAVSEMQALNTNHSLKKILKKSIFSCMFLGFLCCIFFLMTGDLFGKYIFDSKLAGKFIITLAWICPFLYTNTTLISTINGLGKTLLSFTINFISLIIRILSVIFIIPSYGIYGYLSGLLCSQIFVFITAIIYLSIKLIG